MPFVGSLALLLGGVFLFVMALVMLGYVISTMSRTQMQAMQLTVFYFLPSLLLSGFMFPYRGMPGWAQTLGEILPLDAFPAADPGGDAEGGDAGRRGGAVRGAGGDDAGAGHRRGVPVPQDTGLKRVVVPPSAGAPALRRM